MYSSVGDANKTTNYTSTIVLIIFDIKLPIPYIDWTPNHHVVAITMVI